MSTPTHPHEQPRKRAARSTARQPAEAAEKPIEPDAIVTRSAAFIEPDQHHGMISEAAYYRAERRGFDPGHDLEDWFEAEREIERALESGESPRLRED